MWERARRPPARRGHIRAVYKRSSIGVSGRKEQMAETIIVRSDQRLLAKRRARHLKLVSSLVAAVGTVVARAQVSPAPGIAGVIGTIEAVTANSVDLRTKTGVVRLSISQPLTIYHEVPADLSRVTSGSYVGVPSVKQQEGRELAQRVMIFPGEL